MGRVNCSARADRIWSALVAGGVLVLSIALTACGTVAAVPEIPVVTSESTMPSGSVPSIVPPTSSPTDVTVPGVPGSSAATALAVLSTLPVQGRAPQTGYSRAQFGQTWTDDVTVDGGHNGCDTRNDLLRRDISDAQVKAGTQGCVVLSGTLADPYTGKEVPFLRGAETSDDVQIDHLVALSDAWQSGAQQLTAAERQNLANDPINLQATAGSVNQQKGAGDAATWLPPNKSYRCTYVARQIEVKANYRLWVKPAERDAMVRVLGDCAAVPTFSVPTSSVPVPPTAATTTLTAEPLSADPEPTTPVEQVEPSAPVNPASDAAAPASGPYQNCAAAKAAGAAPMHNGEPGYSTKLDGDRDGVACE